MNIVLKDFQDVAVERVLERLRNATAMASPTNRQAVVLAAPTGAGKTVIATRVIERIITGDDIAEPDPNATFLWVTDLPELNQQTAEKMAATSEVLGGLQTHHRCLVRRAGAIPRQGVFLEHAEAGVGQASRDGGRWSNVFDLVDDRQHDRRVRGQLSCGGR